MCNISKLGLIASRLYIALLLHGDALNEQPKTKIMEMVGTEREQSLSDAMVELERFGFARVERRVGVRSRVVTLSSFLSSAEGGEGGCNPLRSNKIDKIDRLDTPWNGSTSGLSDHPNTYALTLPQQQGVDVTLPQQQGVEVPQQLHVGVVEPQQLRVGLPKQPSVDVAEPQQLGVEVSLLERCVEVDALPYGEDRISAKGDFQKRRRVQIPLVQEVWDAFFPGTKTLLAANAKELLVLADDCLETLYEELEVVAEQARKRERETGGKIEHPWGYATKTIERRKGERRVVQAKRPSPVSSASQTPSVKSNAWDGELMEPSAVWLEKRQAALQAASKIWGEQ